MKTIFASAATLAVVLAAASSAQAADAAMPAAYDWTGFYVGANAGVAWNNTTVEDRFTFNNERIPGLAHDLDGNQAAFTGGAMLGYNYQIDHIVLGAEADFNYLGFSADQKDERTITYEGTTWTNTNKLSFEADWFGTIRSRVGYAVDNWLVYGTGGAAYGSMSVDHEFTGSDGALSGSKVNGNVDTVNWGWTVGGGVEYGIDRWSLGVEYLYVDLGSADWNADVAFIDDTPRDFDAEGSVDWKFSVVRATAKLHF